MKSIKPGCMYCRQPTADGKNHVHVDACNDALLGARPSKRQVAADLRAMADRNRIMTNPKATELERLLGLSLYLLDRKKHDDTLWMETPARWGKMLREMTAGYAINIPDLFKTFENGGYDGMVVVGPIKFFSLCEHHLLPFYGSAWVGYLPNKRTNRIVGLSKLARLVEAHAKRFQVQERLTHDIALDLQRGVGAAGVGVLVESTHTCMAARGVEKEGVMRTQTLLGRFKSNPDTRSEFYRLTNRSA